MVWVQVDWDGNGAVAVLCWQGRVGTAAVLLGDADPSAHPNAARPEEMLSLCAARCTWAGGHCLSQH